MTATDTKPGLWYDAEKPRKTPEREVIPRRLVYAMFGLALITLMLVTAAVVTDRPTVGQPKDAAVVRAHSVTISGEGNHAYVVDATGTVLLDGPGGFITVVRDGLDRARLVGGVKGNEAVTITQYENGRINLFDPSTGWQVELTSFGPDNAGTFLAMLNGQ